MTKQQKRDKKKEQKIPEHQRAECFRRLGYRFIFHMYYPCSLKLRPVCSISRKNTILCIVTVLDLITNHFILFKYLTKKTLYTVAFSRGWRYRLYFVFFNKREILFYFLIYCTEKEKQKEAYPEKKKEAYCKE
jgi:hypothetical protein